jgi:hypothetical protein
LPTAKREKELWDEAIAIYDELLDQLKSKNMIRFTTLPMDRKRLSAVWTNSSEIGKAYNDLFKIFTSNKTAKEFSEKSGLSETTGVQILLTNLVGLTLIQYESVFKTSLLFFLEEDNGIRRKSTLAELLNKIENICPTTGLKLKKLIDTDLRNSLAHGTFWIENKTIVLADTSYLENIKKLSLAEFMIESKKINVIAHALVYTLDKKINEGFFLLDS